MTLELMIQERIEQARAEGSFAMVKKFLEAQTPIEYIIAATGWSKEKILQLAEKNLSVDKD